METILEELTAAVKNLPELYQPLFGHEVYGIQPTRNCFDRLPYIKKIFDALTNELKRPLRVLDLGCNLGFFSLHAAEWNGGGAVTGVDLDERNIRVCKILASEHPNYKINFITAKIEEFIPTVKADEYDLVFCFNVLHWVTPKFGFPFVQNLLKNLAEKIPTGLFEFATKSEFPDNNLPVNYRDFLQGYSFIRALFYPVWSDAKKVKRPFLFASRDYVHFEGLGFLKIDEQLNGYGFAKSFRCGKFVVKTCYVPNQNIFERATNEVQFLKELGGKNGLPKLYVALAESDESGVMLFVVRDNINGISLGKKIENGEDFDSWKVIEQILRWMIVFKNHGYYQGDLHCDNFIYTEDGNIIPIDYEYISRKPSIEVLWPFNIKLVFFNLINAVLDKNFYRGIYLNCSDGGKSFVNGKLLAEFRKYVSEDKYRQILELKDDENFFENLYEILFPSKKTPSKLTMAELEVLGIEDGLNNLFSALSVTQGNINVLIQNLIMQQRRIEQLEKIVNEKLK